MPKKNSDITSTHQYCGCGGDSQAAKNAGVNVRLALNHWPLAVETHNINFPDTDHDCTDISASDPRRYPSTDFLISSPECTKHTNADGTKKPNRQTELFIKGKINPADERSRATMWDVCRYAEYHNYNYIIVENVVQVRKWVCFEAWLMAMHKLGYNHKCVYHNSMFSWPTPQSRDRIYVHFWKKGNKAPNLEYNPLAFCLKCQKNIKAVQVWKDAKKREGVYGKRGQYVYCCPHDNMIVDPYYFAAANCIDWSIPGRRIGDISPALVENTLRRIKIGKEKFWESGYNFSNLPFIIKGEYSNSADASYVRSITESLLTQSTRQTFGILLPLSIELNRTGTTRPIIEHLSTITAGGRKHGLFFPFIVENKNLSNARNLNEALSTFTGTTYHGIFSSEKFESFLNYYNGGSDVCSHISQAAGTFVGTDRVALIQNKSPEIEDCYYRTIKAHEVKAGMAFNEEYIVLGSSKEQVKQLGNAITPPAMEWQIKRAIESLN